MIEFHNITLQDIDWINERISQRRHMSCEYCFGNNFIWKSIYDVKVANHKGYYLSCLKDEENREGLTFMYPTGEGDIKPVIEDLLTWCEKSNVRFAIHTASLEDTQELEGLFPGKFQFESNRDFSDYIYSVEDLTNLSGKKYHSKRNHISRFKERNWSFELITEDNIKECRLMNSKWCERNDCTRDPALAEECCAVQKSFKYFTELGFFGGLLRVDDEVVAYTIAERLNEDIVVVHIEKAFSEIQGAYPAINREFVANMCQGYKYVNREEDLGVEGLRKAKLSYHPEILLDKYKITLI